MYTRCPSCETTFRVGAGDLRRAQGRVRCGDCEHVFNAVEYLTEDPTDTDEDLPVLGKRPPSAAPEDTSPSIEPPPAAPPEPTYDDAGDDAVRKSAEGYELEIKAYDEKTGETWSPLDELGDADTDDHADEFLIGPDDADHDTPITDDIGGDPESPFASTAPTWLDDSPDAAAAEQAFTEDRSTGRHENIVLSGDDPTLVDEELDTESAGQLSSDPADAEPMDTEPMDMDAEPTVYEADARDRLDDTDVADTDAAIDAEPDSAYETIGESETQEMTPLPDTEGLPTIQMPVPTSLHDEDFDDSVWERIPGVGAAVRDTGEIELSEADEEELADGLSYMSMPLTAEELTDDASTAEEESPDLAETDTAADLHGESDFDAADATVTAPAPVNEIDDIDSAEADESLNFNVPEDKWQNFFGAASRPAGTADDFSFDDEQAATGRHYDTVEVAFQQAEENLNTDTTEAPEAEQATDGQAEIPQEGADPAEELAAEMNEVFGGHIADLPDQTSDELSAASPEQETDEPAAVAPDEAADASADAADEPGWSSEQPEEEVVMATGEFGAAEISSSLQDNAGGSKTHSDPDWNPEEWQPTADQDQSAGASSRRALWAVGLTLLAVAFVGQLLHYNRDRLAASTAYGDTVRGLYSSLGLPLYPDWSIDSYEIRGSEAVAGENGQDVLDIRTRIASISDSAVGLPQLRVILRDRWSNPVAARTFTPEEYAQGADLPADGLLQPNQSIPAHVAVADPGSGAQGFEVELCLPRRDNGLQCTGQAL